jgi:predicted secreted hydrolase
MRKLKTLIIFFLSFCSASALADLPFHAVTLPRDDAAHYNNVPYPVKNLMEWWYYNGHLVATDGHQFGYYFVIFRSQLHLLGVNVVYPLVQYQITDIDNGKVVASGSIHYSKRNSSYSTSQLDIKLDKAFTLNKSGNEYVIHSNAFDLHLTPLLKPFLIGGKGLIPMGNNTNSYYYSITRLATTGSLTVAGKTYQLDGKKSLSWMDHQWGDFAISRAQWIWMSIQLDNGIDINLVSPVNGKTKKNSGGLVNVLLPDGKTFYSQDFTVTPVKAAAGQESKYPLVYQVDIKPLKLSITMTALAPDQYANGYWEGINKASAVYQGQPVAGYGYTENTTKFKGNKSSLAR